MKNLFNRLYWWATENVFNEGADTGIMIGEIVQRGKTVKMIEARKCKPDCQCDLCVERMVIIEMLIGKSTVF